MKVLSMPALFFPLPRRIKSTVLPLGIVFTLLGCSQADRLYPARGGPAPSFAPIVQEVMPAVVNVSAVQRPSKATAEREGSRSGYGPGYGIDPAALSEVSPSVLDELLRRFLDERHRRGSAGPKVASVALGSGFIIDPGGYVVTDDHVIENAEAVTVVLQDAAEYPA